MKGFTAAVKNNSFEIQINVESLAPLLKDSCQMLAVELRSERDVEESLNSHLRIVSHPLRYCAACRKWCCRILVQHGQNVRSITGSNRRPFGTSCDIICDSVEIMAY